MEEFSFPQETFNVSEERQASRDNNLETFLFVIELLSFKQLIKQINQVRFSDRPFLVPENQRSA